MESLPEAKKYEPLVIRDLSGSNQQSNFKFTDYRLKDLALFPTDAQWLGIIMKYKLTEAQADDYQGLVNPKAMWPGLTF